LTDPHITLQKLECSKNNDLPALIASNQLPDVMLIGVTNMLNYLELGIPMDLNPLIKESKLDLNAVNPKVIDYVRSFGPNQEMYSMPIYLNTFATYYNKSIFDKFGVPYPKDGMTWDEMFELGRKLSIRDGGTQYYGLQMNNTKRLQTQLALDYVNPSTNKSLIQSDGWKKFFETWKRLAEIPGNQPPESAFLGALNRFVKEQTLAMLPDIQLSSENLESISKTSSVWDVVSFPSFKERPKVGVGVGADALIVTKAAKNPKEAMQVLSVLLSNEVQNSWTKDGFLTVLNNKEVQKQYMSNKPLYKGKNTGAFYYNEIAEPYKVTKFDAIAKKHYDAALKDYVYSNSDLNTILRTKEEATNKEIEAELKK
jgi:multiple sugar transport system substrate-binding protein